MRIELRIEVTDKYKKRLSRIGGMFPVGADSFYSREQHTRRVVRISEEIRSRHFSHLPFYRVLELSSRHDLGRMPFVHYFEMYLKRNGFDINQLPHQVYQMLASGVSRGLVNASFLLHDTSELEVSNEGFISQGKRIAEFTEEAQIARLVYYADKLTGIIEDIILGYKLGYFDNNIPEGIEIAENGLPWGFLQIFSIDPVLAKKICDCSMHKFNDTVVEVAWRHLLELDLSGISSEKVKKLEAHIFRLSQLFRKGIMEPVIFVKQREDVDYDNLCSEIFGPVIAYLMDIHRQNKYSVLQALLNMDEEEFLDIANTTLKLKNQVSRFKARLRNVQERWKPETGQ